MTAGTKSELKQWELNTCRNHPRWAWVIHEKKGLMTHQLPGWNTLPPRYDTNYISEGELKMIRYLIEELSIDESGIRRMIKGHLKW